MGNIAWWPFLDWGKDFPFGMPPQDGDGGSSPITLQYVEALRYGAELESTFGDPVRVQRYREAESRAVAATRKLCWNDAYGLIADTPAQKHFSQHANILAVWLDVIPVHKQKDVLTKILATSDPGFRAPKGMIEVKFTSSATGVLAEVDLPGNVSGDLLWKGKTTALHTGNQQLQLP